MSGESRKRSDAVPRLAASYDYVPARPPLVGGRGIKTGGGLYSELARLLANGRHRARKNTLGRLATLGATLSRWLFRGFLRLLGHSSLRCSVKAYR